MNNAIENRLQHFVSNSNSTLETIKIITEIEFSRTPYQQTKVNYYHFLCKLTTNEVDHFINCYLLGV